MDHPKMIRDSVHQEVNRILNCGLIENCETCRGLMRPERYVSIFGKVFEYKKDSD